MFEARVKPMNEFMGNSENRTDTAVGTVKKLVQKISPPEADGSNHSPGIYSRADSENRIENPVALRVGIANPDLPGDARSRNANGKGWQWQPAEGGTRPVWQAAATAGSTRTAYSGRVRPKQL